MQDLQNFTVYNASAGSGKTYTLVQSYLKVLFTSKRSLPFKYILAITFTNKAVAEMKTRIVDTLRLFSEEHILESTNSMFDALCNELNITPYALHKNSKTILEDIIHNYAAFDISTIDGFTHRLIRTFAFDLKLPLNFEVELDETALLNEAVDSVIARAGTDKNLTEVLVDFALEKVDDDKSWDVSHDFNTIAKLLIKENDIPFISALNEKSIKDFKALKTMLRLKIKDTENNIVKNAKDVLDRIKVSGLDTTDFKRGILPNHFKKAANLDIIGLYKNQLEKNIFERKDIYNKTLPEHLANTIDSLMPEIEVLYKIVKSSVFHLKFLKAFYKNSTPLSVLNTINKELNLLKEDQNKILISEFNPIIGKEIKEQPTPFIYERIGEKYKHYFIDEFQDTSVMQWENLIPLLNNALSSEGGRVMIVGDAKQAIYRWRGGKAEQFIDLCNDHNPLNSEKSIQHLPNNYRSSKTIVSFNNDFFKYLSQEVFSKPENSVLYTYASQNITIETEGYVELSFLNVDKDDDRDELFPKASLAHINTCLENGFEYGDITVLVRKKKEGVAVANYLSANGIPIISSETLLLSNSKEVVFINDMLTLLVHPNNNDIKIKVLSFLASHFNISNKHQFFKDYLKLSISELFQKMKDFDVVINLLKLMQLSLYEIVENIVRCFKLVESSNAFIQYYLDAVLEFYQKKGSNISAFLNYWQEKKDTLSIVSPEHQNAVQIMTIHKSKGLEFPIVIFPYADLDIYKELEPKEWFPLDESTYHGFTHALLNFNNDFQYFGDAGLKIFKRHKSEQELDNINLLYVALTRAKTMLFIISKKEGASRTGGKTYTQLLSNYIKQLGKWHPEQANYSFGTLVIKNTMPAHITQAYVQQRFISISREDHNINIITKSGSLWDTNQQNAIEKGNLMHSIMSKIKTKEDVPQALNEFYDMSQITKAQKDILQKLVYAIVNHPELTDYYNMNSIIYNEQDIILKSGEIIRPDRLVVDRKTQNVTIIDYKTGEESPKFVNQLYLYQSELENMGYTVENKIIVYVREDIIVKALN
ncbi:UvrD-helicase domain-containing protein [Flavobacteriaceae bacterium MHTCC 0001]